MNKAQEILKAIKIHLGMEIKLEQMKLADGVTVIEADNWEPDTEVSVVTENGNVALPAETYELEDGRIMVVEPEGVIKEVMDAVPAETEEEAAQMEEAPKPTEQAQNPAVAKKTVEIQTKETYFSSEDVEGLKSEITELKAEIEAIKLSIQKPVEEEAAVELSAEDDKPAAKPIAQVPERKEEARRVVGTNSIEQNVKALLY